MLELKTNTILSSAIQQINLDLTQSISVITEKLIIYIKLLQKWNKVYNLTAIDEENDIATKHILDCLAVLPCLNQEKNCQNGINILDIGSGAGLPAIIWAIIYPQLNIYSLDCVQKKIAFQQQAKIELKLNNFNAIHKRIEDLNLEQNLQQKFDVITARAYASIDKIINQSQNLLSKDGIYFLLKSTPEEIKNSSNIKHKIVPINVPSLNAKRCVMIFKNSSIITN